ncbi:amino acid ABC transporter permease [Pseudomonas citronellolis]|uniref:amino acid ABC transporter permease n=1 Tax=Pseudomonas citronellolis TaxID=53408 RepID=UPI0009EEC7F7|nr:amino acid ABC transporter permease [Pseudomonas citronellolis]
MSALSVARPCPSRYLGWCPAALAVVLAALLWLAWPYLDAARLLLAWTPSLLGGAALNLLMGLVAMALASVIGSTLGLLQLGHGPGARLAALLTRSLRALPWLVVMFYVAYLLPFEVRLGGRWVQLPDWLKAAVGLALPASGYVSEFVRGALLAIPASQWEAAAALALGRFQRLRWVILPQALRALLPPAMNLFCTLLMSTSLANLLGVEELMTRLQMHLSSETRPDLLLPAYLYAFLVFFLCVYPLSRWSRRLEQRWSPPR